MSIITLLGPVFPQSETRDLQLDTTYYITRVLIPPLERIFNLVGADVQQWFSEIPKAKSVVWGTILASPSKRRKMDKEKIVPTSPGKQWDINIEGHFENNQCFACEEPSFAGMCNSNGVYPLAKGFRSLRRVHAVSSVKFNRLRCEEQCVREPCPDCT